MKFDLSHLVLTAAIGVLAWLLLTDSCCGDGEHAGGDTTSGLVQIDTPKPDTQYVTDIREVIRTVFRHDTAAINRLLAVHDSLTSALADSLNAGALAALDSIRLHICDSLALVRSYLETAGDSNVTVSVFARTLGILDSMSIGWRHHRPPVAISGPRRALLVGFTASPDTSLDLSFQYHDRRNRSFQAGYDIFGNGSVLERIRVGAHFTIFGKQ